MSEFAGQRAFITGGARGFGRGFADALAARGAAVILADIDLAEAEVAAAAIQASGGQARAVRCDVSDEESVAAAMTLCGDGLDILVNNAGLHSQEYNEPMGTSGVAKLRRLFDVNLMGVIICTLAARGAMAGRAARIVNIASSASYECPSAYGVSKLAVRGLTASFARELGGEGIRVNAISPGLIMTDTIREELDPATVSYVLGQQILAREGEVTDIVEALLYLISDRSKFMTGETLRVSGGFTLSV